MPPCATAVLFSPTAMPKEPSPASIAGGPSSPSGTSTSPSSSRTGGRSTSPRPRTSPPPRARHNGRPQSARPSASGAVASFLDRHLPPVPWAPRPDQTPPDRTVDTEFSPKRLGKSVWQPPRPKRWGRAGRWELIASVGLLAVLFLGPWRSSREAGVQSGSQVAGRATLASGASTLGGVAQGINRQGEVILQDGTRIQLLGITLPALDASGQRNPPSNQSRASGAHWRPTAQETIRAATRLVSGRPVELEFDPLLPLEGQQGQPALLAYVWTLDDAGRRTGMLNAQLISLGHAQPAPLGGYAYRDLFLEAAQRARGAGLWAPNATPPPSP